MPAPAAQTDLFTRMEAGTRFQRTLTLRTKATGLPINLTGYRAVLAILPAYGKPALVTFTTDAGQGLTIVGAAGQLVLDLDLTTPERRVWGPYRGVADVLLVPPTGSPRRLLQGDAYISPEASSAGSLA